MRRREFIAWLGGAAVGPVVARAQRALPVIGWLHSENPETHQARLPSFFKGLAEVGFSEGRDVTVEYVWSPGDSNLAAGHQEAIAADLVRQRPAAIIAMGSPFALAAKAATRDIPIIFDVGVDPVEFGLVASFNRPGGNLTGLALLGAETTEKRLELLHKAAPAVETIAFLVGPAASPYNQAEVKYMQSAARTVGLRLPVFNVAFDTEIAPVFATLVEHQAGAIVVGLQASLGASRGQILSLAARFALPTMFSSSLDARAGALLSYGADVSENSRQMGVYTGRILKGEKPGDLPVVQPTKFEFVINLKTAKALGLNLPPTLLAIADEVIE